LQTPSTFQFRASTDEDDASYVTYSVITEEGSALEESLLHSIEQLMATMSNRGVPDAPFAQLVNTLEALAADGHSDSAIGAVRQMSLGREFDVKQAVTLVNVIGQLSPFDKVDAAVALFPTLMSTQSFAVILNTCFEDREDRNNIAHRLGITVSDSGKVTVLPRSLAAKQLAARGGAAATGPATGSSGGAASSS
jgi:hypothetical protein